MIRTSRAEAAAWLSRPGVRDRLSQLFRMPLSIKQITVEIGLSTGWDRLVSVVLKEMFGEVEVASRGKKIAGSGGKAEAAAGSVCLLCGECKAFLPDAKRTDGVRKGTCKRTGARVDRCAECKRKQEEEHINGANKHLEKHIGSTADYGSGEKCEIHAG